MIKPKRRSKVRLFFGKIYFLLKKKVYWYLFSKNFAKKNSKNFLKYEIFFHKTPVLRELKDVEMWMQYNKINNLKIAIKAINGLVIEPGQIFSFWRQIGKPSKSKGYLEGMVLHNGVVKSGIGGGLCQLANLLYWMTLHTPLLVTERWRHSYDVFPDVKRKQPFGSGATCSYPNIDFQVKNNTKQKFQLNLDVSNKYLIGKWLSNKPVDLFYEVYEREHKIKNEFWGGYTRNNIIRRKVFNSKKEMIKDEFVTENNAIMMYEPFLEQFCQSK